MKKKKIKKTRKYKPGGANFGQMEYGANTLASSAISDNQKTYIDASTSAYQAGMNNLNNMRDQYLEELGIANKQENAQNIQESTGKLANKFLKTEGTTFGDKAKNLFAPTNYGMMPANASKVTTAFNNTVAGSNTLSSAANVGSTITPYALPGYLVGEGVGYLADDQDETTWTGGEIAGDLLSSTSSGVGTGAMIGSVFGPAGSAVGATIGGIYGFGKGIYKGVTGRNEAREEEEIFAQEKIDKKNKFRQDMSSFYQTTGDSSSNYGNVYQGRHGGIKPMNPQGDMIVYGPTHEQGGVMRDSNTELEGGGMKNGVAMPGEVITNVQDNQGNTREYYFSDHLKNPSTGNTFAEDYRKSGGMNMNSKQLFAKLQEKIAGRTDKSRSPQTIAKNGGYRTYQDGSFNASVPPGNISDNMTTEGVKKNALRLAKKLPGAMGRVAKFGNVAAIPLSLHEFYTKGQEMSGGKVMPNMTEEQMNASNPSMGGKSIAEVNAGIPKFKGFSNPFAGFFRRGGVKQYDPGGFNYMPPALRGNQSNQNVMLPSTPQNISNTANAQTAIGYNSQYGFNTDPIFDYEGNIIARPDYYNTDPSKIVAGSSMTDPITGGKSAIARGLTLKYGNQFGTPENPMAKFNSAYLGDLSNPYVYEQLEKNVAQANKNLEATDKAIENTMIPGMGPSAYDRDRYAKQVSMGQEALDKNIGDYLISLYGLFGDQDEADKNIKFDEDGNQIMPEFTKPVPEETTQNTNTNTNTTPTTPTTNTVEEQPSNKKETDPSSGGVMGPPEMDLSSFNVDEEKAETSSETESGDGDVSPGLLDRLGLNSRQARTALQGLTYGANLLNSKKQLDELEKMKVTADTITPEKLSKIRVSNAAERKLIQEGVSSALSQTTDPQARIALLSQQGSMLEKSENNRLNTQMKADLEVDKINNKNSVEAEIRNVANKYAADLENLEIQTAVKQGRIQLMDKFTNAISTALTDSTKYELAYKQMEQYGKAMAGGRNSLNDKFFENLKELGMSKSQIKDIKNTYNKEVKNG